MSYDKNELHVMFGDDPEIFEEIFQDFIDTYEEMIRDIELAYENRNVDDLQIKTHTLKGVLATFCSINAKETARFLESASRENKIENLDTELKNLRLEVEQLIKDLKSDGFEKKAA